MTPQEKQELKKHLKSISEILVRNTPKEKLKDFEGIELAIREHFFEKIGPEIADFFYQQQPKPLREEPEK
ncbi:MAG: hypothetical protein N5P05_004538 (plasmid) [Chroococcopsis gigantea SAG 12.99]|jgi:hypothetical protein|nr:hypothetical protein [Chroococcopsis gigantea SAG 12.99]MDV3000055.1 hypothetical protein [Chroococcopsis gigantea SAG 12.99]MDV3000936.1 hypothetical protein [Chroococcopsis gigantea SAG 12.99]MDV3001148.1 hypothetical protein [Chroococcopsis gigantea SAG 12.99]MDV3001429.1 hypothetical protein [Chroococcopsis gigantea SAG 12.99]